MSYTHAFTFGVHCEVTVLDYKSAILSIPAVHMGQLLKTKDLHTVGEINTDGKYTLDQHLSHLHSLGKLESNQPILVFGARNLCVNRRSPAVLNNTVYAIQDEEPKNSLRPYYGIGLRTYAKRITCDTLLGGSSEPSDWDFYCAGVPVLWDDLDCEQLLDLMLCEASDHSHIFDLPRGNHPQATDTTRHTWQALQNVFISQLYQPLDEASTALRAVVNSFHPSLSRCDDYFHAITGIRNDGAMVNLFAQGRLENLGKIMRRLGCNRAVCLENSGSIMPTYLPNGRQGEVIPLVRAPNHRPRGRAIIVVELSKADFAVQPMKFATN